MRHYLLWWYTVFWMLFLSSALPTWNPTRRTITILPRGLGFWHMVWALPIRLPHVSAHEDITGITEDEPLGKRGGKGVLFLGVSASKVSGTQL